MDDVSSTGRPRQSQSGRDSSMWAGMESLEGRVYLAGIDPALSRAVTEYLGSKPATAALAEANLTDGNIEESGGVPIVSSLPIFLRQFSVGLQFQNTGVPTDLAIDGSGFFIVSDADGAKVAFTRDGAFSISGKNQLVDAAGQVVNGHTVDEGFVLGNTLVPLAIPPSGVTAIAKATGTTSLVGTLDTAGTVGTTGTVLTSTRLFTAGGGAVSAATTLQSLTSTRGGTVPLFGTLTALTFTPSIGATTLPTQTLVVNSQTTVGDLENFLTNGFGIDTGTAASGVAQAGATIQNDPRGKGQDLVITGNVGTVNAISISGSDLTLKGGVPSPISFSQTTAANGESVSTPINVYDSVGDPLTLNVNTVLVAENGGAGTAAGSTTNTGSTWQYYITSPDNIESSGEVPLVNAAGTLVFSSSGQLQSNSLAQTGIQINRVDEAALTPQAINLDFAGVEALASGSSTVVEGSQDGFAAGDFNSFSIGTDGIITAAYTNGATETIGQIVLAKFSNTGGLIYKGNNEYREYRVRRFSDLPAVATPGTGGTGTILGGELNRQPLLF